MCTNIDKYEIYTWNPLPVTVILLLWSLFAAIKGISYMIHLLNYTNEIRVLCVLPLNIFSFIWIFKPNPKYRSMRRGLLWMWWRWNILQCRWKWLFLFSWSWFMSNNIWLCFKLSFMHIKWNSMWKWWSTWIMQLVRKWTMCWYNMWYRMWWMCCIDRSTS